MRPWSQSGPRYGQRNSDGRSFGGRVAGYDRPKALADSGIVWKRAALRAWMAGNTGFMPGTKMRHVGISDPTVQDVIRAHLDTLRAE